MRYTLKELFDNLEITMTELKRRSGISDVTLISIRNGHSARRSTINKLLRTFSEVYGISLTLKNVDGIIIQGKPVSSPQIAPTMAEKTPISSPVVKDTRVTQEKPQKRGYAQRKTELPEGCISATDFARQHGVKRETFRDHMVIGLGPGLAPGTRTETDVLAEKDHVDYSERPKPGRPKETERYLTPDQQKAAIQFWLRHGVEFTLPQDNS